MSAESSPKRYIKIWFILLILLAISVAGPELGIKVVTLITAFGIAVVKAYIVMKEFMHLTVEKKFVQYGMLSMLFMCIVFYFGIVVDTLGESGRNWIRLKPTTAIQQQQGHHQSTEESHSTEEETH